MNVINSIIYFLYSSCNSVESSACTNPEVLKVILFVKEIAKIVFFLVPIGLIIFIGIDFFKNITASKAEDTNKNLKTAIKRIIYCIIIFFVPTIVHIVNNILISIDLGTEYTCCLENANSDYIEEKAYSNALEAIENAESTSDDELSSAILEAKELYNNLPDEEKGELEDRIEELERRLSETNTNNKEDDSDD